jgi:hypothetical protein
MQYPKSAVRNIVPKYSFEFEIDGSSYRCWHNKKGHLRVTFPKESGPQLFALMREIERLIGAIDECRIDVRLFLTQYMLMTTRIERELAQIPISERQVMVTNIEPFDVDSLSLEDQCLLEVIQEQSEKVEDEVTFSINEDMVKAKFEEKKARNK